MAEPFPPHEEQVQRQSLSRSSTPGSSTIPKEPYQGGRWYPRREDGVQWSNRLASNDTHRHGRQKSLSDAFKTLRTRSGSMSANAHEIADALKAPVSPKLIIFCIIWYLSSALTNTSSKSILNAFSKPVTLTLVQFGFVSSWCIVLSYLTHLYPSLRQRITVLKYGIRYPNVEILTTTLPLAMFQIGGHILSSTSTAKIPVSLVHTIKGLSPLFTVVAYRLFFRVHYSVSTYLSLVPLTIGVMLACSAEFSGNFLGVICAFGATVIFVTQNIFSKKLFNEGARAEADGQRSKSQKLDKLNILCYSSGLAFILTFPLWLWSEGFGLIADFFQDGALDLSEKKDALGPSRLLLEYVFNGSFHFGQNIMAFILLSMVSPVTYSVASLIKRIFVILVAVVWFGSQRTTPIQGFGIFLTFVGLYFYDRTSDAARADRRAKAGQSQAQGPLLPLSTPARSSAPVFDQSPLSATSGQLFGGTNGFLTGVNADEKKADAAGPGRLRSNSNHTWLPPGTKQEDTWRTGNSESTNGIAVP